MHEEPKKEKVPWTRKQKNRSMICNHSRLYGILDHLVEALGDLGASHSQKEKDNLTRGERRAIIELKENPHIVINKADKGSTVVIRDR